MVMILLICKLVVNIHEQYAARVMHVIIRDVVPQHCGIIGTMPLLSACKRGVYCF